MSRVSLVAHQRSRARAHDGHAWTATHQKCRACNLRRISDRAHELLTVTPARAMHQTCRARKRRSISDPAHEFMTVTRTPALDRKCCACNLRRISDPAQELMTVTHTLAMGRKCRACNLRSTSDRAEELMTVTPTLAIGRKCLLELLKLPNLIIWGFQNCEILKSKILLFVDTESSDSRIQELILEWPEP